MRYIFYADVYFIQNFMMKMAVIYLALYCNGYYQITDSVKGGRRITLAAFLGTITEIAGLLLVDNYNVFLFLVNVLELPAMFLALVKNCDRKILRLMLYGYFYVVVINGVLEVLWNFYGETGSYIFYILFSCGAVIVGVRIWRNYNKMQKGIFNVQIRNKGKQIQAGGYYDSGNCLIDPYTGKGVHIVCEQLISKLGIGGMTIEETETAAINENLVYIPYQSLGNETGLLKVYYIDELIVDGEREKITIQNCPVGVTKDNLFEGKKYEIILNEEVF